MKASQTVSRTPEQPSAGPWTMVLYGQGFARIMAGGLCIASVSDEANGRLIAEAPALKMIAELFLEGHGDCGQLGCLCAGARESLARIEAQP